MSNTKTISAMRPLTDVQVVIVTGTFVPAAGKIFYLPLENFFRERGYPTRVVCIPGLGLGDLAASNDQLAAEIFGPNPVGRFIFVGHSQGGIHTALLAHRYPELVVAVFNFNMPWHGTVLANLAPWVPRHPAIRAMAAHSDCLRELRAAEGFSAELVYSFYTVFDQLVVPWFSPACRGGHNVLVAPRAMHGLLKRLGQRRSAGVELVHGVTEHVFIIWLAALRGLIGEVLDGLETPELEPAA